MESVEEVVYPLQRVSVFDGSCIELSKNRRKNAGYRPFSSPLSPAKPMDCWTGGWHRWPAFAGSAPSPPVEQPGSVADKAGGVGARLSLLCAPAVEYFWDHLPPGWRRRWIPGKGHSAVAAGAVRDALVREVDAVGQVGRLWEARQPESQPRGRQYYVPSVAGESQASGCGWQSRAPDRWRALECLSQKPAERRWDRIKRPWRATGFGKERGEPSLGECLPFAAAERG